MGNYPWSLSGLKNLVRESQVLTCPKLYPDAVCVTGGLAKIKVPCNTVHLTGIPVECMTCRATPHLGVKVNKKSGLSIYNRFFVCVCGLGFMHHTVYRPTFEETMIIIRSLSWC